ncbi:MAG: hypothetical protein LBK43_05305 [Treponema sp.]|jgi:hypothetical protein|nr:hypothetical protein [Treponema sp.]
MKQAESKVRYVRNGLIVAMVLLVLGACGEVNDLSQEPQESKVPNIGYNEGDLVTVKVAVPKQTANRSVNAASVEFFANLYEVVFREVNPSDGSPIDAGDPTTYYRGEATAVQGYVDVSVKPNKSYDVLLLAGYNRTLLAAGYSNNGGNGWPIKSGQANQVTIVSNKLPLQWDGSITIAQDTTDRHKSTNDFGFSASLTESGYTVAADAGKRWITLGGIDKDGTQIAPATDTFTVAFNIAKLEQLYLAETGGATLTIQDYKVVLWPRYVGEFFTPVILSADTVSGTVIGPTHANPDDPYEYSSIANNSTISFTNAVASSKLPNKDIDGVLQFELTYQAFGTKVAKGIPWIIRNGLDRTEDKTPDTSAGSYFVVKIGAGTPDTDENVTITY